MKELVRFVATGFYTGYFPITPGTFGSIPAWLLAWFLLPTHPAVIAGAIVITIVAIWSSDRAEKFLGHDSRHIVIDEWAGMLVTVILLPHRLDVYIAAFFLFRFFDVIKPWPSGRMEALPGGWGITLDDVFAGVYANLTCWLGIVFLHQLGWFGF